MCNFEVGKIYVLHPSRGVLFGPGPVRKNMVSGFYSGGGQ